MVEYGYFIHQWDLHLGDLIEISYVGHVFDLIGTHQQLNNYRSSKSAVFYTPLPSHY